MMLDLTWRPPGRYRVIKRPFEWACAACGYTVPVERWPDFVYVVGPIESIWCNRCDTEYRAPGLYQVDAPSISGGGPLCLPYTRLAPVD